MSDDHSDDLNQESNTQESTQGENDDQERARTYAEGFDVPRMIEQMAEQFIIDKLLPELLRVGEAIEARDEAGGEYSNGRTLGNDIYNMTHPTVLRVIRNLGREAHDVEVVAHSTGECRVGRLHFCTRGLRAAPPSEGDLLGLTLLPNPQTYLKSIREERIERGICAPGRQQRRLFDVEAPDEPRHAVLVLCVRPDHGVEAIFLAYVGEINELNRLVSWAGVVELYRAATDEREIPQPLQEYGAPATPPVEDMERFTRLLRPPEPPKIIRTPSPIDLTAKLVEETRESTDAASATQDAASNGLDGGQDVQVEQEQAPPFTDRFSVNLQDETAESIREYGLKKDTGANDEQEK